MLVKIKLALPISAGNGGQFQPGHPWKLGSIIRTKEGSGNSRPGIQWYLRKYWNQGMEGGRILWVSHSFCLLILALFLLFLLSPLLLQLTEQMDTAYCQVQSSTLALKVQACPSPLICSHWARSHFVWWLLVPFLLRRGNTARGTQAHYTLLYTVAH